MPSTLRPWGRFLGRQVLVVVGVLGNLLGARVLPFPAYLLCLAVAGAVCAQLLARRGGASRAAARGALTMWIVILSTLAASTTLAPAQAAPSGIIDLPDTMLANTMLPDTMLADTMLANTMLTNGGAYAQS